MIIAGELEPQKPIGNQTIDGLRELQLYIGLEEDPLLKRAIFQQGIRTLAVREIMQKPAKVTCSEMWARRSSGDADDRIHVRRPLEVLGEIAQVGYMQDSEEGVDDIVVVVARPHITARFEDHVDSIATAENAFGIAASRIPVNALESWMQDQVLVDWLTGTTAEPLL